MLLYTEDRQGPVVHFSFSICHEHWFPASTGCFSALFPYLLLSESPKVMLTTISEQSRNLNGLTNFSCDSPVRLLLIGRLLSIGWFQLFPSRGLASSLGHTQCCLRSHLYPNQLQGQWAQRSWPGSGANHCYSGCTGLSPVTQPPSCNGGWKCSQLCKPWRKRKQLWVISQKPLPQWLLCLWTFPHW